ncbi:para-nitrobenzyl esterase [Crossiella equi]|uniref:Carboxylic ester hydrolase n=1 Tax=Crossiella equi TaxID=130796 RepID=A0ABS5A754_9PSEU|nr:carboxylesterase family protein [Crossiella equi]MBP2472423.1 para-nitrobenzyl esterase [Crossiella equi]
MGLTVDTPSGTLRGTADGGVHAWLGVPYAEPPVRFAAPQTVRPWTGVRSADRPGPAAVQDPAPATLVPKAVPGFSEDCLTVNVWAPPDARDLPVVVWLHGGLFQVGSASAAAYSGAALAARGVVVVGVNYRLGAFGYLAVPGGANFGLQDQELALQWTHAHVAAFGGDPARITLMGQSAGAYAILALATRPVRSLVQRVILQSTPFSVDTADRARAVQAAEVFAEAAGVADLEGLRALPTEAVLRAQLAATDRWRRIVPGGPPFVPFVDGDFLTTAPGAAALSDSLAGLDVLLGVTDGEYVEGLPPQVPPRVFGDRFAAPTCELAAHLGAYCYQWRFPRHQHGVHHCAELPYVLGNLEAFAGSPALGGTVRQRRALVEVAQHAWTGFITDGDPGWAPYTAPDWTAMAFGEDTGPVSLTIR